MGKLNIVKHLSIFGEIIHFVFKLTAIYVEQKYNKFALFDIMYKKDGTMKSLFFQIFFQSSLLS